MGRSLIGGVDSVGFTGSGSVDGRGLNGMDCGEVAATAEASGPGTKPGPV